MYTVAIMATCPVFWELDERHGAFAYPGYVHDAVVRLGMCVSKST